jgi:magnesium transporter
MRLATLLGPDLKDALEHDPLGLQEALEEFHPEDIAEIVEDLSFEDTLALMRILPDDFAAQVLERLPTELQTNVLDKLTTPQAAQLLTSMRPDDRADVVQELDQNRADELIAEIAKSEPQVAEDVRELAAYPEDSAAGLMTTHYLALPPDVKMWQAIEEVRSASRAEQAEHIYYIYVVYGQKLVGVVSLRALIMKDASQTLGEIMTENVVSVRAQEPQEEVARAMAKYDFTALPVVDDHMKLLGVVTIDDVVDVVIEEATEDAQMMGAVTPIEEGYFDTNLWQFFRSRVTWLIVLFVGGFLTASVMEGFEDELRAVIALAVFVPLIISSGGNAGSQSASLIIRALATGQVQPSQWAKVLGREVIVSVALGAVLCVLGFGRAFFTGDSSDPIPLAAVVSISTLAVVIVGSLVGSLLPMAIQRVGLDPAVSSTPFIASLSDVVGLLIYLTVAKLVLGIG